MIGFRPAVQNIIRQGKFEGLKWNYIKKHIMQMEEQNNGKAFGFSFALTIYGLVLFPFVGDMINQEALDVFYKGCMTFTAALVLGQLKWGMNHVIHRQLQEKEGPSQAEINLHQRIKILESHLEESRNIIEKEGFHREKLNVLNSGLKEEVASLKADYENLCSSIKKIQITKDGRDNGYIKAIVKACGFIIFKLKNENKEMDKILEETSVESEQNRASATKVWATLDEC
ncbi:hypothetical protein Lal_00015239 [Lupinus albus]|nr:hypothetical protein Lal_00015239 [Lupinus albus]